MHVGVTTLKKVCRMHNIKRWPYRRRSYIHKLTRKAGSGDGRASANERAAERAREASGALGPAAPHLPVGDPCPSLHLSGLQACACHSAGGRCMVPGSWKDRRRQRLCRLCRLMAECLHCLSALESMPHAGTQAWCKLHRQMTTLRTKWPPQHADLLPSRSSLHLPFHASSHHAAAVVQVLDTLHREGSGLQGAELITTNILLPSLVRLFPHMVVTLSALLTSRAYSRRHASRLYECSIDALR